jgi:hypothetical protein
MEKKMKHVLYPDTTIIIALFRDVENAPELRQAVMGGQFDASLMKPSMVIMFILSLVQKVLFPVAVCWFFCYFRFLLLHMRICAEFSFLCANVNA